MIAAVTVGEAYHDNGTATGEDTNAQANAIVISTCKYFRPSAEMGKPYSWWQDCLTQESSQVSYHGAALRVNAGWRHGSDDGNIPWKLSLVPPPVPCSAPKAICNQW